MLLRILIKNFKSISLQEVHFDRLNILVGQNGTGKSNLLSAITFMAAIGSGRLQRKSRELQGMGSILASRLSTELTSTFSLFFDNARGELSYEVTLRPVAHSGRFELAREHVVIDGRPLTLDLEHGVEETRVLSPRFIGGPDLDAEMSTALGWLRAELASWTVHYLNIGQDSPMRHSSPLWGYRLLCGSGDNLATVLYHLQLEYPDHYSQIRRVVQQAIPSFEDWTIETLQGDADAQAELWWRQRGNPKAMPGHVLSPGQLGVMALAATLLHPGAPSTLLIDEPEAHLHPAALRLVGEIIRYRGEQSQVVVSTHSPELISQLRGSARVIQANWSESGSTYGAFGEEELDKWLKEYTIGVLPSIPAVEVRREAGTTQSTRPLKLTICYSHKDEKFRQQFDLRLSMLRREKRLETWHDRKIVPGSEWQPAIDLALDQADIIAVLLSPDFLASDFCVDKEMTRALTRFRLGQVRIIPVVIRPCDWQRTPLAHLKALPSEGRAVTSWRQRDDAWLDVVQGIRALLAEWISDPSLQDVAPYASHQNADHSSDASSPATMPGTTTKSGTTL